jgi:hypothetical protein
LRRPHEAGPDRILEDGFGHTKGIFVSLQDVLISVSLPKRIVRGAQNLTTHEIDGLAKYKHTIAAFGAIRPTTTR